MQSIVARRAASLVLAVAVCASAQAQHIHDQHPPSPHGAGNNYTRTSMIDNWSGNENVQQDSETLDVLFERRFTNCTCEVVDIKIEEKKERTHQVNVHGSYTAGSSAEAEAKLLAASVKATAHAEVTIGAGYTYTNTKSYTVTQNTTNPKCNIKDFKSTILRTTASGTKDFADHKFVCTCTCGHTVTKYCNKVQLSADGVGFHGQDDKWKTVGPCTEDPCPCDETVSEPVEPGETGGSGNGDGGDGSGGNQVPDTTGG